MNVSIVIESGVKVNVSSVGIQGPSGKSATGLFYPLDSNPSGYITSTSGLSKDVLYVTGIQIVSGLKDFSSGIAVSFISGDSRYIGLLDTNGTVSIDWASRTLNDNQGIQSVSYDIRVLRDTIQNYSIEYGNRFLRNASQDYVLDWNNRVLSGIWNAQNLNISGIQVITKNDIENLVPYIDSPLEDSISGNSIVTNYITSAGEDEFTRFISLNDGVDNSIGFVNTLDGGFNFVTLNGGDFIYNPASSGNFITNCFGFQLNDKNYNKNIINYSSNSGFILSYIDGITRQDIANRILSGTWNSQGLKVLGNNVTTGGPYYLSSNPSGYITGFNSGVYVLNSQTGIFITLNQTGLFYSSLNPSGFITGINLTSYITTGQTGLFYSNSNPSGFITNSQTGNFYPKTNPSGYITGVNLNSYITTGQTGNFVDLNSSQTISGSKIFANGIETEEISSILTSSFLDLFNGKIGVNNNSTIDFVNLFLIDNNSQNSLDWNNRLLIDENLINSLDWDNRILNNQWNILDFSAGNISFNDSANINLPSVIQGQNLNFNQDSNPIFTMGQNGVDGNISFCFGNASLPARFSIIQSDNQNNTRGLTLVNNTNLTNANIYIDDNGIFNINEGLQGTIPNALFSFPLNITNDNAESNLNVSGVSHLILDNPNFNAQTLLTFAQNGIPLGGIRCDYLGVMNWHSSGTSHRFYNNLDSSDIFVKSIGPSGFLVAYEDNQGGLNYSTYAYEARNTNGDVMFYIDAGQDKSFITSLTINQPLNNNTQGIVLSSVNYQMATWIDNLGICQFDSGSIHKNSGFNFNSTNVKINGTGIYLASNPSGFITGLNTGNFITSSQTGNLTGNFYPLNSNPSGYMSSSNYRAGTVSIGSNATTKLVAFSSNFPNTGYSVSLTPDATMTSANSLAATSKTVSGFTISATLGVLGGFNADYFCILFN